MRTKNKAHAAGPLIYPAFFSPCSPRRKSFGTLKFAPKEAYIGNLTDGRLNINAANYYRDLPGERGDSLEASLAYGTGIYASWLLPFSACSRCERATSLTAHDIPYTATSFTVPPIQARPSRHSRSSRATLLSKRLNTHHYTHEKGQRSLVESVTLKAPAELLYDS